MIATSRCLVGEASAGAGGVDVACGRRAQRTDVEAPQALVGVRARVRVRVRVMIRVRARARVRAQARAGARVLAHLQREKHPLHLDVAVAHDTARTHCALKVLT